MEFTSRFTRASKSQELFAEMQTLLDTINTNWSEIKSLVDAGKAEPSFILDNMNSFSDPAWKYANRMTELLSSLTWEE